MIAERGEARDDAAVQTKCRNPVRDDLLSVRDDLKNRPTQCLERAALRLVNAP